MPGTITLHFHDTAARNHARDHVLTDDAVTATPGETTLEIRADALTTDVAATIGADLTDTGTDNAEQYALPRSDGTDRAY